MEEKTKILLKVSGLKKYFPTPRQSKGDSPFVRSVDGVDLTLEHGQTLGLVGESGCGKSTLVRTIANLYTPTEGEVFLEGHSFSHPRSSKDLFALRKEVQMVFQDPHSSLNPRMTVEQLIAEPLEIYRNRKFLTLSKDEIKKRVNALIETVGLSNRLNQRYPHEFSGGQKQRICVARALALNPKVILADEPVSALDVSVQAQILNLFIDLQKEFNLAYLFIAHDLAVIQYISKHIAVMYLGRIVEYAEKSQLYKEHLHPYTQALLSAVPSPDPKRERNRTKVLLKGDIPSPIHTMQGCYFYDRCPVHMDKCLTQVPKLKEVRPGHLVACYLYYEPD